MLLQEMLMYQRARQVLYNTALILMTFTLTTWNLPVYTELELRPTLHNTHPFQRLISALECCCKELTQSFLFSHTRMEAADKFQVKHVQET